MMYTPLFRFSRCNDIIIIVSEGWNCNVAASLFCGESGQKGLLDLSQRDAGRSVWKESDLNPAAFNNVQLGMTVSIRAVPFGRRLVNLVHGYISYHIFCWLERVVSAHKGLAECQMSDSAR